jgi:O-antigen/teichoic acid export membrane protein
MLKGALRFSLFTCLAGFAAVSAGFYLWAASIQTVLLAAAVTLFMVAQAASLTTSHLVRTAIGVGKGDGYGNLLIIIPALVYLAISLASGRAASVSTVFLLFSAGALTVVTIHFVLLRRKLHALYPDFAAVKPLYQSSAWRARSFKLWVSNGLEAANQHLDVLIIGYLMSPSVAGAYFVTTRLANAFATASDTMHMFSTRHIPDLYFRGELKQLGSLLNSVAAITLAIVLGGLVVILAGGEFFLSIFNEAYAPYYTALAVLCIGTAAVAAAGPSGSILMLTGHEGRYLSIIATTVLIRALGFFVLVPAFGIIGAVTSTAVSFVFMAAMLRHASTTLTGLDGSVLRLAGAYRRPAYATPAE